MRAFVLATMLLAAPMAHAADKPNPADYTITVHVISSLSTSQYDGSLNLPEQVLQVVIDGQSMQLTGSSMGVLALGDYPARLSTKVHGPRNPNTYDVYKGYDVLLPDGNVRTYTVTRLGPAVPNP